VSPASDEVAWADDEPEPEVAPLAHVVEVVPGVAIEQDYADEGALLLAGVETAPRRNRYFLALWVMAIGFVALGILLYVMSVATSYTTTNTNGSDVVQLVFSQLGWMLAAPLITVGLLTVVVLVLIQALRPRPRRD
jgi:heme/copper-type cytochrome/quinol oxidase subunit 2